MPSMVSSAVCSTYKNCFPMLASDVNNTSSLAKVKSMRFLLHVLKIVAPSLKRLRAFSNIASAKKKPSAGSKPPKQTYCACKISFVKYVVNCVHSNAKPMQRVVTVKSWANCVHCVCFCRVGKWQRFEHNSPRWLARRTQVIKARKTFARNLPNSTPLFWLPKQNCLLAENLVSTMN
ncbi:unannotated protein [freshwater metagenome]|uniref:Unannotated protein n=1 Tax=freshwater metagenome TaxID=449393 RepID=A0A6J6I7W1_9ZZZZ